MIEKSELLRIPAFEGLPDDQLDWFISQSTEVVLKAGDIFLQQGTPAVWMIIMLEGQMQMRGALGGEAVTIPLEPGEITGLLPFSRMKVAVLLTVIGAPQVKPLSVERLTKSPPGPTLKF
jgi:CRP-like cAMP-binding protein